MSWLFGGIDLQHIRFAPVGRNLQVGVRLQHHTEPAHQGVKRLVGILLSGPKRMANVRPVQAMARRLEKERQ